MNQNQQNTQSEPWYRIGMVWLMIGLPAIVVVACLITINIAIENKPQIVQQEKLINQR